MIDFLHPGYLPFAAAAIVPVLIHLLQRHRARVVEFSSVALLHGAERRTIRRLRLRQILLMILRSLILLLVALALAHPIVTGLGRPGIAGHRPTALAIAVDNSMSMGWVSDGRSLLDRSLDRVRGTLDLLREGDRVVLVYVPGVGSVPRVVEGADAIREVLPDIHPLPIRIAVADLAATAAGRLAQVEGLAREVHLHSDLQGTAFPAPNADGGGSPPAAQVAVGDVGAGDAGGGTGSARTVFPADVRLVLLTERTGDAWNGAVTALRIADAPLTPAEGVRLEGTVRFRGPKGPGDRALVRLRREDGGREVRDVTIGEDGMGAFTFALGGALEGSVRGSVEVDPDPLAADDRRYFTVRMPGRPRVWFPSRGSAATPLRTALRVLGEEVGSIDLAEWVPDAPLGRRDILLVESPGAGDADRLREVIARGGGAGSILVVPASGAGGLAALNGFLSLLGLPERYGGPARPGGDGYVRIDRWSSVAGENRRCLDAYDDAVRALHFRRFFPMDRNPAAPDEPGRESIDFHTGDPWAVLLPVDAGGWRVLFAGGFGPEWGGFYRDPLFVPFLDTLLRDLVRRGGLVARSFRPGERVVIDLPGVPDGVPVDLVPEGGTRERVFPEGGALVHTIREAPGNVSIEIGGVEAGGFAVNPDGAESNLEEADPSAIAAAFGHRDLPVVRAGEGMEDTLLAARGGRDVWDLLLLLAFLMLLLEARIANRAILRGRRPAGGSP